MLNVTAALRRVAERNLAEVRELIHDHHEERDALELDSLTSLPAASRLAWSRCSTWPEDEFAAGHLPCAANIPLRETYAALARDSEGPGDRRLLPRSPIAYSPLKRCRFCASAATA